LTLTEPWNRLSTCARDAKAEHNQTRNFLLKATTTTFTRYRSAILDHSSQISVVIGGMAGQLGAASTVAARRCIQNDEIISNILLFKPLKTTESAENKALVNIALVCKALEEPAMNELWRDLYSFAPLLLLLPCIQLIRRTYVSLIRSAVA
jgi:hypothetical protein